MRVRLNVDIPILPTLTLVGVGALLWQQRKVRQEVAKTRAELADAIARNRAAAEAEAAEVAGAVTALNEAVTGLTARIAELEQQQDFETEVTALDEATERINRIFHVEAPPEEPTPA